jgi:hypothetical protein
VALARIVGKTTARGQWGRGSIGAPRSHKNLWPEPWPQAHRNDPRENAWHKKVCNGTLTLRQAQKAELAYTPLAWTSRVWPEQAAALAAK